MLMAAVEASIKTRYPEDPVYWDQLPKDFERPSFTLECQKEELSDVNIGLVRRRVTVLVTCYVETDAYYDSSREALNQRMDTVLGLFGRGFLRVEDRSVTVQAGRGTGAPDYAEISAVFDWVDRRPGYQDPEAQTPESGGAPLMEDFALHVSNGKD